MSYTEIYKFTKSGKAKKFSEIGNAFRGAMSIWQELEKRYLPKYVPFWAIDKTREYSRCSDLSSGGLKEVWALQESSKLLRSEKIVLLSTFDNVVVMRENVNELINSFMNFGGETSLVEQAKEIEKLCSVDKNFIAIAWNQTSVNGDMWQPYNMSKENKHWDLFKDEALTK